jgi:predicted nuclease with TOPRIM domain
MKHLSLLIVTLLLLTGCGEDCTPLTQERDQLEAELAQRDSVIQAIGTTFGLIDSNLVSLKEIETELMLQMREPRKDKEAIQGNVDKMKAIMELNKTYINDLQGSLDVSNATMSTLFNIINSMDNKIMENNLHMARLNHDLGTLGEDFKGLFDEYMQAEVSKMVLEENLQAMQGDVSSMEAKVKELENQMSLVYVASGSKRELIDNGVLEKGGLLRPSDVNEDFDTEHFDAYDMRKLETFDLASDKARIVTEHPSESYVINGQQLRITDSKLFWSISKFLIVVTD